MECCYGRDGRGEVVDLLFYGVYALQKFVAGEGL